MSKVKYFTSVSDRIYMFFIYLLLWFCLLIVMVPILFVIASSFSSPEAIANGRVFLWPVDVSFKGYNTIFSSPYILRGFANTVKYTTVGTAINITMTLLAAYPLSRKDIMGRNAIMFMFAFTMLFNGGMIPTYLVVRKLGILDGIWAMVLPNAMAVWNVIITRTYLQSNIPNELYECATLDGCRDSLFVLKIVIPLAKPIIAVMVLLYAIGHWNAFFSALIYLRDPKLQPLQIVLRDILVSGTNLPDTDDVLSQVERLYMRDLLQYSLIIVSSLPVMLLYPFIQRYFIRGIMIGSIKG